MKNEILYLRNWMVHKYKYLRNNRRNYIIPIRMNRKEYRMLKTYWDRYICNLINACNANANNSYLKAGTIELKDYIVLSKATGDMYGKVISKDGAIFRIIRNEKQKEYEKLWKSGLLQGLMKNGLIPKIKLTKYYIPGFSYIFEIEKVDISYADMWTYSMIKDAAICAAVVKKVCNHFGYYLVDGHSSNISFHKGKAMWIDIGSIELKAGRDINCGKEIMMTMGYRMLFDSIGNSFLSKKIIYDENDISMKISPFEKEDTYREFVQNLRVFKKYHIRSGFRTQYIIHRLFDELDVEPWYIDYLFRIDINKFESSRKPNEINFDKWITLLRRNNIKVFRVAGIGYNAEAIFLALLDKQIGERYVLLKFDEIDVETSYKLIGTSYPVNVYMVNYMYRTYTRIINAIQSELIFVDDILNNLYVYGHCDLHDIFYSLSIIAQKYIIFSFYLKRPSKKELLMPAKNINEEILSVCKEYFSIIDSIKGENKEDYIIVLAEKNK